MDKYEKLNFMEIYLLFDMFTSGRMKLSLKIIPYLIKELLLIYSDYYLKILNLF